MSDAPTVVTSTVLRDWPLPDVDDEGGKDSRGTVLLVGGAADTPGAVLLAGLAALRVGAGKLTVATVEATATPLAVAVPEAAVRGLPATSDGTLGRAAVGAVVDLLDGVDAVVVGPGMRGADDTRDLVAGLLAATGDLPVVLDAMALTCGAVDVAERSGPLVATPNLTEAGFLLDGRPDDEEQASVELARSLGAVVALRSRIAAPDGRVWVDESGDSGLGTSGSGDVLAGAVGGLLARGCEPAQAAVWGAHLHAQAGVRLSARVGRLGYLARELLDELPQVLTQLER